MTNNKTCMQLLRRWYQTCICATNFRYNSKHQTMTHTEQTKDRPPKHQSARRAYVASLAIRGNIYHKGLGTRNWTLCVSVEVQCRRCRDDTVWTMYAFIYPTQKILRLLEICLGTRGRTMKWYWNIRFDPSAMWGPPYLYSGTRLKNPNKWFLQNCITQNIGWIYSF